MAIYHYISRFRPEHLVQIGKNLDVPWRLISPPSFSARHPIGLMVPGRPFSEFAGQKLSITEAKTRKAGRASGIMEHAGEVFEKKRLWWTSDMAMGVNDSPAQAGSRTLYSDQ